MLCRGHGKIGIFGHRKSAALAEYAYYLLNPLLSNVWPIAAGEPTIADQLIDLEPRDRLLAFTFQRYAKVTGDVVRLFRAAGAPVVLITDDLLAPAAGQANHVLVCQGQATASASAATAIVVLEALAAAIALRKGGARNPRMDTAEQLGSSSARTERVTTGAPCHNGGPCPRRSQPSPAPSAATSRPSGWVAAPAAESGTRWSRRCANAPRLAERRWGGRCAR